MAWLARLDARARSWPRPLWWGYTALKWYLVAAGLFLWLALWWQRHPLLAVMQAGFVGYVLFHEGIPRLRRRQRRHDPPDRRRDPL